MLVSVAFILSNKVIDLNNEVDQAKEFKKQPESQSINDCSLKTPLLEDRSIQINKSTYLIFMKSGNFSVVEKGTSWLGESTTDTLIKKVSIINIAKFEIQGWRKILKIYYADDTPIDTYTIDNKFSKADFYSFAKELHSAGYQIDISYKTITVLFVIGIIIIIGGIIFSFYAASDLSLASCSIVWILIILGIFLAVKGVT